MYFLSHAVCHRKEAGLPYCSVFTLQIVTCYMLAFWKGDEYKYSILGV